MSGETIDGEATTGTVRITGHQDDEIPAYLAHPPGPGSFAGVVVIHHMPGYDEATKQIARTFAANGYTAIMPNLHWRDAPAPAPTTPPRPPGPPAACLTSAWSATSTVPPGTCGPWTRPTARWA
jgi:dienelactone hydrolase